MKKKINAKRIGAMMLAFAMATAACTPAIASFTQAQPVANKKAKSKAKVKKSKTKKKKSYKAKAGTVNLKAITLTKGKSKTISVKSKSKVTWKTSNKSVVSVKSISKSKVKITAKKEGNAKVSGKAGKAKWSFTVKVKVKVKGNKKFDFWIEYAPKTIKYYSPGFAANYVSYGSRDDGKDPEGSDVAMITGGTLSDKSKISCISSDTSILKIAKFTKADGYEDSTYCKSFKLIPYKTGTVTITMTYPGGSYKTKVTVKPSAVYEKIKNFIPAVKNSGLDDAHKAYLIAAWLYKNTTYGYSDNDGVYGLLVEGKGVCEDYATTYECLTSLIGFDTHTLGSEIGHHAWNQIKLNNKWYNADVTGSSEDYKREAFSEHFIGFVPDSVLKEYDDLTGAYKGFPSNHILCSSNDYKDYDWSIFEQTSQFKQLISL